MTTDIMTDLICTYLYNKRVYLDSDIDIVEHDRYLKYKSLLFDYCGHTVEIRIHNAHFIEVKADGKFGCVCDCIQSVRDQIDRLSNLRY